MTKGPVDPNLLLHFQIKAVDRQEQLSLTWNLHPLSSQRMSNITEQLPKRIVNSARRTNVLQKKALTTILEKIASKSIEDPVVYGSRHHYNKHCCWGTTGTHKAFGAIASAGTDDEELGTTAEAFYQPVHLSQFLQLQKQREPPAAMKATTVSQVDVTKYVYLKRTIDKVLWPLPNTKSIASKKSLAEMMISGHVPALLAQQGIIPVVVSPNHLDKKQSIKAPFGPLLNDNHQPYPPGSCFNESFLYSHFRLKKAVDHHDPWLSNVWTANAMILRLVEKNGMPTDTDIDSGLSPLGEIQRLQKNRARKGFEFYGSGGNPVVTGFVRPNANAKGSTEGATFETCQTVSNKLNFTMEQICERGCPMVVILGGDVLPPQYRDRVLQKEIGCHNSQAMYMGVYQVQWCAQEAPLEAPQIKAMMEHYKLYYNDLDETQMRFHLEPRKKFVLVPSEQYREIVGGYYHLEVDTVDTRKPLFEVPGQSSYNKVLSLTNQFSEKQLLHDWISQKGYLELIDNPFSSHFDNAQAENSSNLRHLQHRQSEQSSANRMAVFTKRKQFFKDHWNVLLNCSVAAFLRMLEVNVDAEMKIGPLIDHNPTFHTNQSALPQYLEHFGAHEINFPYMTFLEPELQKSPTTHPIRTYDPKVLLLMNCNGGGMARSLRPGLCWMENESKEAADLFFQCILVEVVRVQILLEWCRLNATPDTNKLPTISDIPAFLIFIGGVIDQNGTSATGSITHDQYELNASFYDWKTFQEFFSYLEAGLEAWFCRVVVWTLKQSGNERDQDVHHDLFRSVNERLTSFLTSIGSGLENTGKQPFHSQHILMDYYEVVADFPFGEPICPVLGFGGSFGAQLLQDSFFNSSNWEMVKDTMVSLKNNYCNQNETSLEVLGLIKLDDGTVAIKINQRRITTCEPEHGCCMQYIVLERKAGGSKGLSTDPKLTFTYCHPIRGFNFKCPMAVDAILTFKQLVQQGLWGQRTGTNLTDSDSDNSSQVINDEDEPTHQRSKRANHETEDHILKRKALRPSAKNDH
jgi:hypothetical protein